MNAYQRNLFVLVALLLVSPVLRASSPCCHEVGPEVSSQDSLYQSGLQFTTDAGQPFQLASLSGHPVVIAMFYSSCTYACPLTLGDLTRIKDALPKDLRDTRLVLVSFDSKRDQPSALKAFRESRQLGSEWILLNGSPDTVREFAALLGVKYRQLPDGTFEHSNLITILNAAGEIIHQRAGLQGPVHETVSALVQAAAASSHQG